MGKKKLPDFVKEVKMKAPETMNYYVPLETDRDIDKYIKRIERIVRSSMEYRSYIQFLKENIGLDSCIFFQNVTTDKERGGGKRISIELHHEPLTLYDIVSVVVHKYKDEGFPVNDLLIADEVLLLHYENKVGLVPLSKTPHQMIHNSTKLMVPLTMVYGSYSDFLDEYEEWIPEELFDKIERKLSATEALTEESFDALVREFTYLDVDGYDDVDKMEKKEKEDSLLESIDGPDITAA